MEKKLSNIDLKQYQSEYYECPNCGGQDHRADDPSFEVDRYGKWYILRIRWCLGCDRNYAEHYELVNVISVDLTSGHLKLVN
jgi:hypothetical protein